jgi:hypothetical protein
MRVNDRWRCREGESMAGRLSLVLVAALASAGCASVPDRPARSTLGCARAVVMEKVPAGLADKRAHCVAAAMIARYCSRPEAVMASLGKEVKDLFGRGDAEWADLRADREGLRCAKGGVDDKSVLECCLAVTVP